jgi:Fe-S cluster biogenesis protein NfuA
VSNGDHNEVRENIQRIGGLVQEIESIADPAIRGATKDLVQLLMDLHGAAIEKALEIVSGAGEAGTNIIDRLGRDPLVSAVLVLYGLHPEGMEGRVARALDRIRPQLRKQGCEVELMSVDDCAIRLRVETGSHTCGSTAKTLQSLLEESMYDAAPDLTSLVIEGFEEKPASGFIALEQLIPGAPGPQVGRDLIAPAARGTD